MTDRQLPISYLSVAASASRWVAAFLVAVLLSAALGVEAPRDQEAVRIRKVVYGEYASLIVENRRSYDVTVTVKIHGDNVGVLRLTPETETYRGHSQTEAVRVGAEDRSRAWSWSYRFHWTKGNVHARHDDETRYLLPFEAGRSHRVTQGYNGRLTHDGHNRYAVDFAMHEGTPVCAARDGVVVDLMESSEIGGPSRTFKDEANYVSVAHRDGTIGEYLHLKYDGVLVEIGQTVEAGQRIALSGNTGYSTLPHLHFGVYSALDSRRLQSHPVTFVTARGLVTDPVEGKTYTAK
jgi:murein DD-endopeptidase MepM/ murein hydrolase activator NlpD